MLWKNSVVALSLAATTLVLSPAVFANTISDAQQTLQVQGLYNGPIDGKAGPRTAAAVKKFQAEHNLRQTGHLNRATLAALGGAQPNNAGARSAPSGSPLRPNGNPRENPGPSQPPS